MSSMVFWSYKAEYPLGTDRGHLDHAWMIFTLGWLLQLPLSARFWMLAIRG